jgi:hypothetical protein
VKRRFVSHAPASQAGLLKTIEVLLGLDPLTIEDAQADPMLDLFAAQPVISAYGAVAESVPLEMNPGKAAFGASMELDGPDSFGIPAQEWASIKGSGSLARHESYLRALEFPGKLVAADR